MLIYIICPVRNILPEQQARIDCYIEKLKENHTVYYPLTDAPQNSQTGLEIVNDELKAIERSDEIHIFWDINSKGSHFDLGMAIALKKKLKLIYSFHPDIEEKSYEKVIKLL